MLTSVRSQFKCAVVLLTILGSNGAAAETFCKVPGERLTGDQLDVLRGATVDGIHSKGPWREYYFSGNRSYSWLPTRYVDESRKRDNSYSTTKGIYKIEGDKLCISKGDPGNWDCFHVNYCESGEALLLYGSSLGTQYRIVTDLTHESDDDSEQARSWFIEAFIEYSRTGQSPKRRSPAPSVAPGKLLNASANITKNCWCMLADCGISVEFTLMDDDNRLREVLMDDATAKRAAREHLIYYDTECKKSAEGRSYLGFTTNGVFKDRSGTEVLYSSLSTKFSGMEQRYSNPFREKAVAAAAEQARRAAEQAREQAQRSRLGTFVSKYKPDSYPSAIDVAKNPFVFERKTIALTLSFREMLSADSALFEIGAAQFVVEGLPSATAFRSGTFLVAVEPAGYQEVVFSAGTIRVVALKLKGYHACSESNCSDILGDRR